jgi:DNA repair protein RadD
MYKLREYQQNSVDKGLDILQSSISRKELLVLPTGAGKSIVIAEIVKRLGEPVVVLQPSKELLEQNYQKFINVGGKASMYSASVGEKNLSKVTFATIGSIKKEVTALKKMGVSKIIVDEAHIGVKSGSQLRSFLKDLGIRNVLGLTATPFVLESTMFGGELKMLTKIKNKLFTNISYVYQMRTMLKNNFWTPITYDARKQNTDLLEVNSSGSDYTESSLIEFYLNNDIESQIVDGVRECFAGDRKSILVFVPSITEAENLSKKIPNSEFVSSLSTKKERDRVISGFKSGDIPVVINVGILTTGFDYPELDTIILARSTMSFALYYQMVGRGVRIHPDKKGTLILDLSENFKRFGKVEDFTVEYLEDYGWGLFKGESLISNYPIDAYNRPTKSSLVKKKAVKPVKDSDDDVIFHFGKYKDKRVSHVLSKDKGYLSWLIDNKDFNWFGEKNIRLKVCIKNSLGLGS